MNIRLDSGEELSCGIVCIGKGVRPNIKWLADSGLHLQQGVVVDRHTRTNHPDIHAAGDVAVTFDPITGNPIMTGLWTNAVEMGRCAGANMAGKPTAYSGTFGILNATQVAEMPFVSMGIVHVAGTGLEVLKKRTADSYRKLVFSENGDHLVGAVFIGDISKAGLYHAVIREKKKINDIKKNHVAHTLHYGHLLQPSCL